MKIKEKLKAIPELVKKIFEKFPLTILAIVLFTIFTAIVIDTKFIEPEIYRNIMSFIIYLVPGTLLVESWFEKTDIKKIISYIVVAIISVVLVIFQNNYLYTKSIDSILWKILVCYVLTLCILSVYFLSKKSNKDFTEYVVKVFINVVKTSIIYGVLAIGISIVSAIFVYLIWEKIGYSLVVKLEIILLGFYYIPKLIYCLVDVDGEVNAFFKGLIKYALTTLLVISFVIIYMYIIKILILRDMPKNQIFRILSALFIIGMPIWTMMQYFKDESFWYKISLKLPIAFIPFILLQIYTIGIRILDNGFTPLRYICVALIIFEIIYILIYSFKKEKIEILLLIFNAIIIISLIVPGINMFKISNISQAQNLKIFKNKSEYTEEEKEKIYGAYVYLNNSKDGEEYINKILDEEDIQEIKLFKKSTSIKKDSNTEYIQASFNDEKIDIEGYSDLYIISTNERSINTNIEKTFSNVELECQYSNYSVTANLSDEFENYIDTYMDLGRDGLKEYFESNNEIEIDDDKKIIITSFYLNYNEDLELVKNYSIKGYLLEK